MFYDHFVKLCSRKGVSPTRAAVEAGINKSAVTYWKKHGDAKPTGQIAAKLCDYFGLTMGELYGEQQEKPAEERAGLTLDDFSYSLFSQTKELTAENKNKLLEMAAFFKQQQEKRKK